MDFLKSFTIGAFWPNFYRKDFPKLKGSKIFLATILYSFLLSILITGIISFTIFFAFTAVNSLEVKSAVTDFIEAMDFSYVGINQDYNLEIDLYPQPFIIYDEENKSLFYINSFSTENSFINDYDLTGLDSAVIAFIQDSFMIKPKNDLEFKTYYYKEILGNSSDETPFEGFFVSKDIILEFINNPQNVLGEETVTEIATGIKRIIIITVIVIIFLGFLVIETMVLISATFIAILLSLFDKNLSFKQAFKYSLVMAMGVRTIKTLLIMVTSVMLKFVAAWGIVFAVYFIAQQKNIETKND